MAKSKKSVKKETEKSASIPFEESLDELQQIVGELEEGALGLEESMHRFERGVLLLRGCFQTLERAEQRIEILTRTDEQGNPAFADFDASATIEQPKKSAGRRRKKATEEPPEADDEDDESDQTLF